jgi:hypothetical protein
MVYGTWNDSGSPYLIEGNIYIPHDSLLFINPGTRVLFLGPYQMQIYGYLNAGGTMSDSVFFSCPDTVDSWLGIRLIDFVQILPDSVRFTYCSFTKVHKDPDSLGGAFYARNSPRVSIDHCLFKDNHSGSGGAIYLRNSSVVIRNTLIKNNEAERGGGMYFHQSSPKLSNLEITGNVGGVGGGIYYYNSNGYLHNSMISDNTSNGGGGGIILHKMSDVHLKECEIANNIAYGSGGGIAMLEDSKPFIEYCKIKNNTAFFDQYVAKGGGIFITQFGNYPTIENTEISYNVSADDGGGIYTESPMDIISSLVINNASNDNAGFGGGGIHAVYQKCLVLNCTFSGNLAQEGTAIYATGADVDLINSIIWDNGLSGEKKIYMRNFLTEPVLKIDYSVLEGGEQQVGNAGTFELIWGENNIPEDPSFADPMQNDYSLADESPCIDKGLLDTLAFVLPGLDIAKNPRVNGPAIDMGCYENQSAVMLQETPGKAELILNIYPVPVADRLTVQLAGDLAGSGYTLDIFTSGGQLVYRERRTDCDEPFRLTIPDLLPGYYVLHVYNNLFSDSRAFTVMK